MSIEIGQVIIQCDRCLARLVHDPSPDPVSSFTSYPRWSSKDAVLFAIKAGWSFDYEDKVIWVICPSCASEMAAVKFNRLEQGKPVLRDKQLEQSLDDEYPVFHAKLVEIESNGNHMYITNHPLHGREVTDNVNNVIFLNGIRRPQGVQVGDVGTMHYQSYPGRGGWYVFTKLDELACDRCDEKFLPSGYRHMGNEYLYCESCQDEID